MNTPDTNKKPTYKHLGILLKSLLYFSILFVLFVPRTIYNQKNPDVKQRRTSSNLNIMKEFFWNQRQYFQKNLHLASLADFPQFVSNKKYVNFRDVSPMDSRENPRSLERQQKKVFISYPKPEETSAPLVMGISIYNPKLAEDIIQVICIQDPPSPRLDDFRFVSYRYCPLGFAEERIK